MSKYATQPRILFVTPKVAFIPEWGGRRTNFIHANVGGFDEFPAELIGNLFDLGVDVHVAQPDFRQLFAMSFRKQKAGVSIKLPCDRVHLAEDRALFHSKSINSNSEWENIRISLAFQREVLHQIIPRVQPDIIHCHGWMTGLIPAAARKFEIPSLFTVHQFSTARSLLSYVEDQGIDAAAFWQSLFYHRYPVNYEETRKTNPADFLLSGVFSANFVMTIRSAFMANRSQDQSRLANFPIWKVLANKIEDGCAAVYQHRIKTQQYIEIYEKMLQDAMPLPMSVYPSSDGRSNFLPPLLKISK